MSDELSAPMLDGEVTVAEPIIIDGGLKAENQKFAECAERLSEKISQTTSNSEALADSKCGVNDIPTVNGDVSTPLQLPKFLHLLALAEENLASVKNIYDETEDPTANAVILPEIAPECERETESDSSPQEIAVNPTIVASASELEVEVGTAALVEEASVIVKVVHVSIAVQTDPEFESVEQQKPCPSNHAEVSTASVPCAVDNDAIAEEDIVANEALPIDTNGIENKDSEEHDSDTRADNTQEILIELQEDAVQVEDEQIEVENVVEVEVKEVQVKDVVEVECKQVELKEITEVEEKQVEVQDVVEIEENQVEIEIDVAVGEEEVVFEDIVEVDEKQSGAEEVVIVEVTHSDVINENEAAVAECVDKAILDDAAVSIAPSMVTSDQSDIAAPEEYLCPGTEMTEVADVAASDEPTYLESITVSPDSDPVASTSETTCPVSGLSPCMCASKTQPTAEDEDVVLESVVIAVLDVDRCGLQQAEVAPDSEVVLEETEVVLTVVDEMLVQNLDEVIFTEVEMEVVVLTVSDGVVAVDEDKEVTTVTDDVVFVKLDELATIGADVNTNAASADAYASANNDDADELAETDMDEAIITDMEEIFAVRQSTYPEKAAQAEVQVEVEVLTCEGTLTAIEYTAEEEEENLIHTTSPTLVNVCVIEEEDALLSSTSQIHVSVCVGEEETSLIPPTSPTQVDVCDNEKEIEKAVLPSVSPSNVDFCDEKEEKEETSASPTLASICDDNTACSKDVVDRITEETLEGEGASLSCENQEALTRDEMMVGYSDDMYLDENALKVDTFSKRLDYLLSVDKLNSPKKGPEEGILVDGEAVNEIVVIKESIVVTENIIIQENMYIKESIVIKECITMETTKATYRPASLVKPERVQPSVLEVSDTAALEGGVVLVEEDIMPSCDATESVTSLEAVAEGLGLEGEVQGEGGIEGEGVEDVDMPDEQMKSSLEGLSLEDAQDPDKNVKSKVSLFTRLFGKKEPPAAEKVFVPICCSGVLSAGTCYSTFADDSLAVVACEKTNLATTVSDMITSEDTDEGFTEA